MCSVQNILRTNFFQFTTKLFLKNRAYSTEAELLDLFQNKEPVYTNELVVEKKSKLEKRPKTEKRDVVISCLRPEYNHYRNQKYDKFKPVPLASKGWGRSKSIGDHFTIRIYPEDYDVDNHFWEEGTNSFNEFKLDDVLIAALDKAGFSRPTKIQADTIPVVLSGKNTLIAAETGCGKTLAYLIPVFQHILNLKQRSKQSEKGYNSPLAVVITPSRELATQIGEVAREISYHLPLTCDVLVGGRTKHKMLFPKFKSVDLLVATLGALSKLTTTGIYKMDEVKHLVLDESDTLLDDSFNEHIVRFMNKFKIKHEDGARGIGCQLILASATLPKDVDNILSDVVDPDSLTKVTSKHLHRFLPHVPQTFLRLRPTDRPTKLLQIGKAAISNKEPTIIFSNRSPTCDWISLMLNENGVPTINLNGDMPVIVRKGKFEQFRNNEYFVLSCTDIASRGMDTKHVKHVLNFDFPMYMADYIHRCGRTGRCGSLHNCRVTNFISGKRDVELLQKIEMAVRTMDVLPNVNANITKIIQNRIIKSSEL